MATTIKKSTALPEHTITDTEDSLSKYALSALEARERVNEATADEKEQKDQIAKDASTLRTNMADNDNIIGKVVISPPDQTAVRVEFRINNGSLDIDEMDKLDKLFESARPELFEKAEVVDKVTDPDELIVALTKAGLNPWDYLDINVKKNMDKIIIDKGKGITKAEAILPLKGILAKLPTLIKNFSEEAKIYIRAYLKQALSPIVVLGTRAKT